jgi:glycosyltransferase involved in cell wall biosynthesis
MKFKQKKILFFHNTEWVMGKIHYELARVLYPHVNVDVACWRKGWTAENIEQFLNKYDYISTTLYGAQALNNLHGVQPEKIIAVSHGQLCGISATDHGITPEFIKRLAGVAVVSNHVKKFFEEDMKFGREFQVLPLGVFTDNYPTRDTNRPINTIGNFGVLERIDTDIKGNKYDVKRGKLLRGLAERTNMNFDNTTSASYLAAEGIYANTDIYAFASVDEGNPMGLIEAAACGIPTIGPITGIMPEAIEAGFAFGLPFEDEEYLSRGVEVIDWLRANPKEYRNASFKALEWAKNTRDWDQVSGKHVSFLSSLD